MRVIQLLAVLVALPLCYGPAQGQGVDSHAVLSACKSNNHCAVRFVYNPPIPQDNIVMPLILRQATKEDSRYGKWSVLVPEGLTQWISPVEMEALAGGLGRLNLTWTVSPEPISFGRKAVRPPPPSPMLPWEMPLARRSGTMEIDINAGSGAFVADLPSKHVCTAMKELDSAFHIPVAPYNFRGMQVEWGCKVLGFNPANRPEPPKARSR